MVCCICCPNMATRLNSVYNFLGIGGISLTECLGRRELCLDVHTLLSRVRGYYSMRPWVGFSWPPYLSVMSRTFSYFQHVLLLKAFLDSVDGPWRWRPCKQCSLTALLTSTIY